MKLSKERKVYIALFSAGLVALAVDRALFSPAPAGASVPGEAESHEEAVAAPATAQAAAPRGPSFGARLAARVSWVDGAVPDAFEPSEAWVGKRIVEEAEAAPAAESSFAQTHKLTGVVLMGSKDDPTVREGIALVGSKQYKVGERLDGYELIEVRIAEREAVFKGPGGVVTLRVPGPSVQERGPKGP